MGTRSSQGFTLTQIRDLYSIPDWYPGDHPPMPEIVAHGRRPGVFACGYCHLPNGLGRAENSSLAGLPAAYIEQQLADYRSGTRGTAKPERGPPKLMIANSKQTTESDVREAARYFAALPLTQWVRVIEAEMVPKTRVAAGALLPTGDGIEPLGERIIELPENLQLFDLRDARSGFVAYVPPGSIARGRELVANGAGGVPCDTCHGAGLRGAGPIPGIAGRSPSYIVRELSDFPAWHSHRRMERTDGCPRLPRSRSATWSRSPPIPRHFRRDAAGRYAVLASAKSAETDFDDGVLSGRPTHLWQLLGRGARRCPAERAGRLDLGDPPFVEAQHVAQNLVGVLAQQR